MSDEVMDNFTPRAQQVLALARKEACRFNHNFIGTEHVLLGIIKLAQGVAFNVLRRLGLDSERLRLEVEKQVGTGPDRVVVGNVPYTPRVKKVLSLASKEAKALNHAYVGTEHILLGLIREGDGVAARVLKGVGVDLETARLEILKELDPNYQPEKKERTDVSQRAISDVPARYFTILYLTTDDMPDAIVSAIDAAKLLALERLVEIGYFQNTGVESVELLDRVVRGSGDMKVLKECALIYERILPPTSHGFVTSVSHVEDRFTATAAGSVEERRFGTVLQILTGKPVQRIITMDFLTPVSVGTPSGGLV